MMIEENNRKVQGASVHDTSLNKNISWSDKVNSATYESCPDSIKLLIQETDLDELVFWKLKEQLEKQVASKQNEILKGVLADVERPLFAIVLSKTNGNQSKAAEILGCNRNTLHRKLKEFSINPKDCKKSGKKASKKEILAKVNAQTAFNNSVAVDA
jgi:DNA-binding protein Fis